MNEDEIKVNEKDTGAGESEAQPEAQESATVRTDTEKTDTEKTNTVRPDAARADTVRPDAAGMNTVRTSTVKTEPAGRGDKIASGVIGALIGALVTLLIMVPAVFLLNGPGSRNDSNTNPSSGEEQDEGLVGQFDSDKMNLILKYIDSYFLYDTDIEKIEDGVLHGLLNSLDDDYACYYNEEEFAELMETNEGTYYGIGVMVSQNLETNVITVSHVFRNSPAEEAGLKAGDVFREVAGQNVEEMNIDDVVDLITGEEGSHVKIRVYRESIDQDVVMEVERRQVEQDMVYWDMLEDGIAYVQLIQFTGNASEQLAEALTDLESRGMRGLILDLRGNPGGLLDCVRGVAAQLLPEGNLLTIKTKYTSDRTYPVKDSGFDYPLVVLVNEYSASASEVLTGAIQDYQVGTIVGTTTFGKGIVQDVISLGDGTGLKFTTADYYTPLGRNIHGVGIDPDVYVELESEEDEQLQKAIEVMKEKLGR